MSRVEARKSADALFELRLRRCESAMFSVGEISAIRLAAGLDLDVNLEQTGRKTISQGKMKTDGLVFTADQSEKYPAADGASPDHLGCFSPYNDWPKKEEVMVS